MPTFDERAAPVTSRAAPGVRARSGADPDDAAPVLVGVLGRLRHPARRRRRSPGPTATGASVEVEPDVDELDGAGVEAPRRDEQSGLQRAEGHRHVGRDRDTGHDRRCRHRRRWAGRRRRRRRLVGHDRTRGRRPPAAARPRRRCPGCRRRRGRRPRSARRTPGRPREPTAVQVPAGPPQRVAPPRRGRGRTGTRHRRGSRAPRAWPPPRARRRRCCPSRRAGRLGARRTRPAGSASSSAHGDRQRAGRPLHEGSLGHDPERLAPPRARTWATSGTAIMRRPARASRRRRRWPCDHHG